MRGLLLSMLSCLRLQVQQLFLFRIEFFFSDYAHVQQFLELFEFLVRIHSNRPGCLYCPDGICTAAFFFLTQFVEVPQRKFQLALS